ncbi:hypothetical protein MSIBF_A4160002 [groundwater metagenome]|uniref:Uncharacterized protein n=1 Tax=groundwater metagenome TaxID=717931 RepID=A0A098EDG3_9ZZZZ
MRINSTFKSPNSKGSFLVILLQPVELITQNYVKLPYTYDIIANLLTFYA